VPDVYVCARAYLRACFFCDCVFVPQMIIFTVHYAARILVHFNTWQYFDEIAPFGEFAGGFRDSLSLEGARVGVSSGMRACVFFKGGGGVPYVYLYL